MLVLLFGPTGAGKSAVIKLLVERTGLTYIRPQMTRPPRPGENDKEFVSESNFSQRERLGEFIWVNKLFGFSYGTPRKIVETSLLTPNLSHLLDFPIEGIDQVDHLDGYKAGILIMPPSKEILIDRLNIANRQDRISQATEQYDNYKQLAILGYSSLIDNRIIINLDIEDTYKQAVQILGSLNKEQT